MPRKRPSARPTSSATPAASASRRTGRGAGRATAPAAATRCARSTSLELDGEADFKAVKAAYRRLAKANHPDLTPGDEEAALRFQKVKAAYDVLRRAEERREACD